MSPMATFSTCHFFILWRSRLLFIVQQAVEFVERRLHDCHRRDHRLDALLHVGQPAWRRQRYGCRAGRLDLLRGRDWAGKGL
jgi:hypothetical protein